MRTIIYGSRTIQSYETILAAITTSTFAPLVTSVLTTQESGPGVLGYRWAVTQKIPVKVYTADWKSYGKPAGIIRDREMATFCDAAVLLWDGTSADWMTPALREYFKRLDPPVRCYFVKVPGIAEQTLVEQGREQALQL